MSTAVSGGSAGESAGGTQSAETLLYDDLTQVLHLTPANASGVLGNLEEESSFNPNSYNARENAHGFENWEGGRWSGPNGLEAYAAAHGLGATSVPAEIGFLNQELTGPFSSTLAQLRNPSNTPQQAAFIFDTTDERSTAASIPAREGFASTIFGQASAGKTLTGGPGGSTLASTPVLTSVPTGVIPTAPGGSWDPLNWPGDILGGLGDAAGSAAEDVLQPIFTFVFNSALVFGGIILVVVALVVLAKSSDDTPAAVAAAPEAKGDEAEAAEATA